MSVYAFDQLLLSVSGRPALTSATRRRDFPIDGAHASKGSSSAFVHVHQRFLFQGKLRRRIHSGAHKTQELSLKLYGVRSTPDCEFVHSNKSDVTMLQLKKPGVPRTLLAGFSVDVAEHTNELQRMNRIASRPLLSSSTLPTRLAMELSANGGLWVDSKIKLFFDGFLLESTRPEGSSRSSLFPWRLPSATTLLSRRRRLKGDQDGESGDSLGITVDRQIELVRWRERRGSRSSPHSTRGRRGSTSHMVRRRSSATSRELSISRSGSESTLGRDSVEEEEYEPARSKSSASISLPRTIPEDETVAAQANAQLSFELIERKASNSNYSNYPATTAHWPQYEADGAAVVDENQQRETQDDDLQALRAECAEQKALIRQLLIENRRLLSQQQSHSKNQQAAHDLRRGTDINDTTDTRPFRALSRRGSLTFDVVDGQETFVDHKFDHLVSEIASELAELLSEECSSLGSRSHSSSSSSSLSSSAAVHNIAPLPVERPEQD